MRLMPRWVRSFLILLTIETDIIAMVLFYKIIPSNAFQINSDDGDVN